MVLFKNNKLYNVSVAEDSKEDVRITITPRHLSRINSKYYVKNGVYALKNFDDGFTFVCTESPFIDDSGIGARLTTPRRTAGGAILEAISNGYEVFNGEIKISNEIIKNECQCQ